MTEKVFNRFLYGGDYNPNQWPKEVWTEDMRIFQKAEINSASINIFSWAKIQPSENEYDFSELDEIVDMLSDENYDIVLGTSTASLPGWLSKRYPDVHRVDFQGRRHRFGQRHNACPHSLNFQKFAKNLVEKLAERYHDNPHVTCWHISNEYGGECYCDSCEKAFQAWLKDKYQTIEALNEAWNMHFWGHTLYDFDEVVVPNELGDAIGYENTAFAGISIDYRRFTSDSMLENFKMERDIIRQYDAITPITTNLMGTYKGLDYFKWAKEMDIVSWDHYPSYDTPWSYTSMCHDLMRGIKDGQSFMLMEQTPSQQNWQPYNSLKRPGQMRAQSYQTVAHGADTIQFFQLRRSKGACEKFHGAVIEHVGHEETRVFKEVAQLGHELPKLNNLLGARSRSQVGIIFDWDNYWALEYTSGPNQDLKYVDQIHHYYEYFYRQNISVDILSVDSDFSKYDLIVAPVLYLVKEGLGSKLETFVEAGGNFVTTFMSGIVNESDNVHLGGYPGPLRQLTGIWVEEIDALAPEKRNQIEFHTGIESSCRLLCDIIHLENAKSLATYQSNFYKDTPVITENDFGKGKVWYVGSFIDEVGMTELLNHVTQVVPISPVIETPTELEISYRETETESFYFLLNFKEQELPLPERFIGKTDVLTGQIVDNNTTLSCYDTLIFTEKR